MRCTWFEVAGRRDMRHGNATRGGIGILMKRRRRSTFMAAGALAMIILLGVGAPLQAEKPEWAGGAHLGEKEKKKGKAGAPGWQKQEPGSSSSVQLHFTARHREQVQLYYQKRYQAGHCPPGLAKKKTGCLPPGQVRKWRLGGVLPPEVIIYDLPEGLVVQLDRPPVGYRYVRVAADILLIAIGSRMVVDAIYDLGHM